MTLFAKLYVDIIGDEKLMRAARKGARELVILPWLFAFAKKANDDGRLTVNGEAAEPLDIAQGIPCVTTKRVARGLTELEAIGVLARDADGALRLVAWPWRSGTQSKKPSEDATAARDRKRRQRESELWRDIERDEIPVTPRDEIPVTSRDAIPVTEPVTPTRPRARSRELEKEQEPRAKSESVAHAREALIAKLGDTEPARDAVSGFLDCLPTGGVEEIKWVQLLAVGFLEGAHMPGRKPARPEHVLTALVEFNLASRHEWPYSGANVRSFIERVQRGELRARENGTATSGRAVPDAAASQQRMADERAGLAEAEAQARERRRLAKRWGDAHPEDYAALKREIEARYASLPANAFTEKAIEAELATLASQRALAEQPNGTVAT